jgi:hypothetical protein
MLQNESGVRRPVGMPAVERTEIGLEKERLDGAHDAGRGGDMILLGTIPRT